MNQIFSVAIIYNAALLYMLSGILGISNLLPARYLRLRPVVQGLMTALLCIAVMALSYILQPGVAFDTRSVLISVTALIFGAIPVLITVAASSVYRLAAGGAGTLPGLVVIFLSAIIGLVWRRWIFHKNSKQRWLSIYSMSIVVHTCMLASMLLFPYPESIAFIRKIGMPVMLIYPIFSILLSLHLLHRIERHHFVDQLKESEDRFRLLFNKTPIGYLSLDRNGHFIEVNQQWLDNLGYTREEVIGKWFGDFLSPSYSETFKGRFLKYKEQGHIHIEFELVHKSGACLVFDFEGNIGYETDGEFKQTHSILHDISDRKSAENALMLSENRHSSYIENAPDAIFITDEDGYYIEVNKNASAITGFSQEELLKMNIRDITDKESMDVAIFNFRKLQQTGSMSAELKYLPKNGLIRWWTVSAVRLSENRYLGFSSDITDRKETEEKLVFLSYHDYLTGLYNRRFFEEETKRLDVGSELPLSVIIGDINGLKIINDTLGYAEGDKIIIETAELIRQCCRSEDIPSRTGGDEFSIILPRTDDVAAYEVLVKIQNAFILYNSKISRDSFKISIALGFGTKETAEDNILQAKKIAETYMSQRKLLEKTSSRSALISSIKATMLAKSQETGEHAERLVLLTRKIGRLLLMSQSELDHLELFATLHDIGKVGISDQILNKPGKLNAEEWKEMKKHPAIGSSIAKASPELMGIAEDILCHHERWDGKGYPRGLSGTDIPISSRILAIVDSYDAMTEDRHYRGAMSHQDAMAQIRDNAGIQFDPELVKLFIHGVMGGYE
ncbi:MAG: PAS domain S-box protein [Saccharofermentanales bacterium]